jgi:hypothetical protein
MATKVKAAYELQTWKFSVAASGIARQSADVSNRTLITLRVSLCNPLVAAVVLTQVKMQVNFLT